MSVCMRKDWLKGGDFAQCQNNSRAHPPYAKVFSDILGSGRWHRYFNRPVPTKRFAESRGGAHGTRSGNPSVKPANRLAWRHRTPSTADIFLPHPTRRPVSFSLLPRSFACRSELPITFSYVASVVRPIAGSHGLIRVI